MAVIYAGTVFLAAALYQLLRTMTGSTAWAWLSPEQVFDGLADILFGIPGRPVLALPTIVVVIAAERKSGRWRRHGQALQARIAGRIRIVQHTRFRWRYPGRSRREP